MVHDAFLIQKQ